MGGQRVGTGGGVPQWASALSALLARQQQAASQPRGVNYSRIPEHYLRPAQRLPIAPRQAPGPTGGGMGPSYQPSAPSAMPLPVPVSMGSPMMPTMPSPMPSPMPMPLPAPVPVAPMSPGPIGQIYSPAPNVPLYPPAALQIPVYDDGGAMAER